jgi:PhnB protein
MSVTSKAGTPGASWLPENFATVTPYFLVKDVKSFIDFLKAAFDAELVYTIESAEGVIGHCEMTVGTSKIMASNALDRPPTAAFMYLYVPDVDTLFEQALAAGADMVQAPTRMYYGDYVATVRDPFGNAWSIASHVEDMSHEELNDLARKMWSGRRL